PRRVPGSLRRTQRTNSAHPEFDDASYQTDVQVKVVDVTETGAAMQWRQSGKGLFQSSLSGAMGQQATRLLDRLEDFTVEYSVDEKGQFEAVTNRDAIRAFVERKIMLMKDVAGDGAERKIMDRALVRFLQGGRLFESDSVAIGRTGQKASLGQSGSSVVIAFSWPGMRLCKETLKHHGGKPCVDQDCSLQPRRVRVSS
ncbi:MAG TPA: hypothetical protein VG795_11645, partial [Acidimicrobiia bacterium]|nr:hypothetical protein [Acidimicrobiia bacterium]